MQLLAKFEKILYMGFRATLNFRNYRLKLPKIQLSSSKKPRLKVEVITCRSQNSKFC